MWDGAWAFPMHSTHSSPLSFLQKQFLPSERLVRLLGCESTLLSEELSTCSIPSGVHHVFEQETSQGPAGFLQCPPPPGFPIEAQPSFSPNGIPAGSTALSA